MLYDLAIGQYIFGDSLLHRADPRTKIIITILYMSLLIMIDSYKEFFFCTIFTVFFILASKVPVKYTLKGLKPIVFIIIITGLINIFTTKGESIFELFFLKATFEGIDLTIKMALRLILIITSASMLTLTTTPITLTDGIEKLFSFLKRFHIPVHEIAFMMAIAIRFIPTLVEETDKLMKAQASRGADFGTGNIFQKARSYLPLLIPLLIGAFKRAEDLAMAMEARCYTGGEGRTRLRELSFSKADLHISIVFGLFCALVIVIKFLIKI